MQLTSSLKTRAANWANLQVMTSIDQMAQDFGDYHHIFIYIIKEQWSDQEESKWWCENGSKNNVNDGVHQIKWLHIVDTPMAKWASMERQQF